MTSSSAAAAAAASGGHGADPIPERPPDDSISAAPAAGDALDVAEDGGPLAPATANLDAAASVGEETEAIANEDAPPETDAATSNSIANVNMNSTPNLELGGAQQQQQQQEQAASALAPTAASDQNIAAASSADLTQHQTHDHLQTDLDNSSTEKNSAPAPAPAPGQPENSTTPLTATTAVASTAPESTAANPSTPPPQSTAPAQTKQGDDGANLNRSWGDTDQRNFPSRDPSGYLRALETFRDWPANVMPFTPETYARPSTITPSEVHISNMLPKERDENVSKPRNAQANDRSCLEVFARIEFADSTFQVTTHKVVIGRDRAAIRQASMDEKREEQHRLKVEEHARLGLPAPMPPTRDRNRFSRSYVSEEGGMLGPESSADDEDFQPPAKKRKFSSAESSVHDQQQAEDPATYDRQYVSHTPGSLRLDLAALRPSPDYVAFVGIHSPGPNIAKKSKGISRQHLQIQYNTKTGQFEASAMHQNGFFHEEVHRGPGDKVVLRSGDRLQIKDVDFRFLISGAKLGCTGAETGATERKAGGGKEMSFDFEANGNGKTQDTSDELSDVDDVEADDVEMGLLDRQASVNVDDEPEDHPMEDVVDPEQDEDSGRVPVPLTQPSLDPSLMMPEIPKKRGPGRPPKNGIMSKRQQRELKKAQQELERQQAAQAPPVEPPAKRKVGRPRKHPLPEGDASAEKRKYKPRKPKGEDGGEGSDAEKRAKEKKSKTPRIKSPPLELRREDYTEQQLQKPNKNYGMLIDEMLTAEPDGLTLKQIYKRICSKYPWFYFHTETKGWESSVRHNLIGNEAFKKDDVSGFWRRVPGVELDAGKRRKASSPDRNLAVQALSAHGYPYNQAQQHMAHGPPPGYPPGHQPPQAYQTPNYNPQQPGQAPRPAAHQFPSSDSLPTAPSSSTATPHQQPPYAQHPPPSPAQPGASSSYSSPYSAPPHLRANPPVKVEDGSTATRPPGGDGTPPAHSTPIPPGTTTATGAGARSSQGPQQPQQQQQQFQAPASTASTTPATKSSQPLIEPTLVSRLNNLRVSLADGLKRANTPHAQDIVWSALDRIVGLKKEPSGLNKALEATCYNGMNNLIQRTVTQLRRTPTPDGNNNPSYSTLLHPDVSRHIEGLRNQCVGAIRAKLPEGDAIALVHSAIIRTLGLANESRLAGRSDSFDNLEKAIMRNVGGVINQMSPPGRASSERASSAGPRPSPAAPNPARASATPQAPTPVAPQASPAPAPASQGSAGTAQPKMAGSPPVPPTTAAQAPQAPQVAATSTPAGTGTTAAPAAAPTPQPPTQQAAPDANPTQASPPQPPPSQPAN